MTTPSTLGTLWSNAVNTSVKALGLVDRVVNTADAVLEVAEQSAYVFRDDAAHRRAQNLKLLQSEV